MNKRERERERKQITKTEDCSAPDCVNKYIKKGASGSVCANCQEVLKKFVAKLNKQNAQLKLSYGRNKPKSN